MEWWQIYLIVHGVSVILALIGILLEVKYITINNILMAIVLGPLVATIWYKFIGDIKVIDLRPRDKK